MKFMHMADCHIGQIPEADRPYSKDRAYDIKDTFANAIKYCGENKIDLLLIAGDLFNRQPLISDLNEINELFKTIPDTVIFIVAGENDCIRDTSSIPGYNFSDNVHFCFNDVPKIYEIPKFNLCIHAFSLRSLESTIPIVDSIDVEDDDKTHILLTHGGEQSVNPIDFNALNEKNFTYCALGHLHNYTEVTENKIYYPGTIEPLNINETGKHGVIIGKIDTDNQRLKSIDFLPLAKIEYIPLKITINDTNTKDELVESITKEIEHRGIDNIYKIRIEGDKDPDLDISENDFSNKIKITEFIDETTPLYDFPRLSKEHPQDMIGAFIRSFNNENIDEFSETKQKALYYGIDALLKTRDKDEN